MAQSLQRNLCLSVMINKNRVFLDKIKKEFAFEFLCLYNSQFLCSTFSNVEDVAGIVKPRQANSSTKTRNLQTRQFVGLFDYRGYGNFSYVVRNSARIPPRISSLSAIQE